MDHTSGLDRTGGTGGYIGREGSLDLVQAEFRPLVSALRDQVAERFAGRLHSAYLYGSVPRGTARAGRSDLDVLLALRTDPTEADRAEARAVETELDAAFDVIDGAGILLFGRDVLLSDLERHDLGWFVACLCTPLLGADLAELLPRYRPTSLLARETNGDLGDALPRWRRAAAEATGDAQLRALVRGASRKLVRTAFTLVMPRYGGWTSNLTEQAEAFARYYPERAEELRKIAVLAGNPVADRDVLTMYTEDLGPWLAAEYLTVHGAKSPRP
ncbi:nucleotidyltransferase domain-containing protein [Streptomyces sp. MBT27]|uniref:nucleotidyltransferase domain-containing protein n=1 Tax=Streptomyces sp. MBT27 TaxID=1488356 RepID=UPI001421A4C6|nr:nucleotidyltransferase domain-containing protein [Streptomyces sp. MBT27]